MRKVFSVLLLLFSFTIKAQDLPYWEHAPIDSLKQSLQNTNNDTLRLILANRIQNHYFTASTNFDSAIHFARQLLQFTQKLHYKIDEAYALDAIGLYMNFSIHSQTLETFFKGIRIAEDPKSEKHILPEKYLRMMLYWTEDFTSVLAKKHWQPEFFRMQILASLYNDLGAAYTRTVLHQQKAFDFLHKAIGIYQSHNDSHDLGIAYKDFAEYFASINQYDSCIHYAQKSYDVLFESKYPLFISQIALIGTMYYRKGDVQKALALFKQAISFNAQYGASYGPNSFWLLYHTLGEYHLRKGDMDSSLHYSRKAYETTTLYNMPNDVQKASVLLAKVYNAVGKLDSAAKYYDLALLYNDIINNIDKKRVLQSQDFDEQLRQQEFVETKNKIRTYWLLTCLGMLLLVALMLLLNNRKKKKSNALLQQKNQQIESTLKELKATQAQLVQSEKMASLGELTAGIAHEIQNPLNFVNNFAETNTEMLQELREEADKGNLDEVKTIAADIIANEQKITHHGKRAESIVKGMLEHSRASSSQKELTDLNRLIDEYLRLAYHGLRAKDKNFNAAISKSFDESIGKIGIVPQEIGRVLLNLFNNAFYAVEEQRRQAGEDYEPIVAVSSKRVNDKIIIAIKDNGIGIPQNVLNKVFQPFFTTKPTGQGTGLGLSLSYDIIKAHGGELKVESTEGEGATFTILLPSA
jgi:signal transduction histidine kinase